MSSIRFKCPACEKAIEVDESDANQRVICFYCRQVVIVPEKSDPQLVGTGAPGGANYRHISEGGPGPGPGRPGSKLIGLTGFVCILAALALMIVLVGWLFIQMMPELQQAAQQELPQDQIQQMMAQRVQELIRDDPIPLTLMSLSMMVLGLIGLVFAIMGIALNNGRGFGIAGVAIVTAIVALLLLRLLIGI
ncbi:MAG: hypothetical protein GXY33_11560 [Phycisphaerae bacterium]|nr:hypothetical protein [Phycisphaerae bacterium]